MSMKKMLAVVAAASLVAVAAPAFAANPFSDVPMNHWAYDAIEQLSAKGILEGYPNGTYRGGRTMTRYEIACLVARLMNAGLTGEELERLKALVVEFQPELEALGVKVDDLDARVTSLEKGLKGWKISGQMRFDYNHYDNHDNESTANHGGKTYANAGDANGWQTDRMRLFLHRDLDNGVQFDMRLHNGKIDRYWMTANDFLGVDGFSLTMGQFVVDWMLEDGTTTDMDSWFMDLTYRGALLKYAKGPFEIQAMYASDRDHDGQYGGTGNSYGVYHKGTDAEIYAGRIKLNFNEKLWLSVNAYSVDEESGRDQMMKNATEKLDKYSGALGKYQVYWASLGFGLTDGIMLQGSYFMEDIDELNGCGDGLANPLEFDDSPDAFDITLKVDQKVLKVTSLIAEYVHMDQGFFVEVNPWTFYDGNSEEGFPGGFKKNQLADDVDILFFKARQQWTDKFASELRYVNYDQDNQDDATEWSVELFYQYTPAILFSLGYADMDGRFKDGKVDDTYDNQLIRFRTLFNF